MSCSVFQKVIPTYISIQFPQLSSNHLVVTEVTPYIDITFIVTPFIQEVIKLLRNIIYVQT